MVSSHWPWVLDLSSNKGDGVPCYLDLNFSFLLTQWSKLVSGRVSCHSRGFFLVSIGLLFPLLFHLIWPSGVAAGFPFCLLYLPHLLPACTAVLPPGLFFTTYVSRLRFPYFLLRNSRLPVIFLNSRNFP